ncbi:MAG: DinB family protein [Balneolaceae bacterium]
MNRIGAITLSILLILVLTCPALAQEAENDFKEQFTNHFSYANRVVQLAKAIPAEDYSWRPAEGVMSIEEVFAHIAQSNYYYLTGTLGLESPEGLDLQNMGEVTGKDEVLKLMEESIDFVNASVADLPEEVLTDSYQLYGRSVTGQAVLFQLVTHLSEHVGQSIAYARMNGVTPPWSQ